MMKNVNKILISRLQKYIRKIIEYDQISYVPELQKKVQQKLRLQI